MSDQILVTGFIDLDPAKLGEALDLLRTIVAATREEDGCEHYSITPDNIDEGRLVISERWRDQAATDVHMQSPNLAQLMGAMGSLGVTGASVVQWLGATENKVM